MCGWPAGSLTLSSSLLRPSLSLVVSFSPTCPPPCLPFCLSLSPPAALYLLSQHLCLPFSLSPFLCALLSRLLALPVSASSRKLLLTSLLLPPPFSSSLLAPAFSFPLTAPPSLPLPVPEGPPLLPPPFPGPLPPTLLPSAAQSTLLPSLLPLLVSFPEPPATSPHLGLCPSLPLPSISGSMGIPESLHPGAHQDLRGIAGQSKRLSGGGLWDLFWASGPGVRTLPRD